MRTVCEVPGIFHATALRLSLFLHLQGSRGAWPLPSSVPEHHDAHAGQALQPGQNSLPAVQELR